MRAGVSVGAWTVGVLHLSQLVRTLVALFPLSLQSKPSSLFPRRRRGRMLAPSQPLACLALPVGEPRVARQLLVILLTRQPFPVAHQFADQLYETYNRPPLVPPFFLFAKRGIQSSPRAVIIPCFSLVTEQRTRGLWRRRFAGNLSLRSKLSSLSSCST